MDGRRVDNRGGGMGGKWYGNCAGITTPAIIALALVLGITALAVSWLKKMSGAATVVDETSSDNRSIGLTAVS